MASLKEMKQVGKELAVEIAMSAKKPTTPPVNQMLEESNRKPPSSNGAAAKRSARGEIENPEEPEPSIGTNN